MAKIIRQGDVVLTSVASIPKGAVAVPLDGKRMVLAYGEVTGHAHAIYDDVDKVRMWAVGKVKYLEVMAGAMVTGSTATTIVGDDGQPVGVGVKELPGVCLKHEEHTHHVIPPGVYKLPVQVEYEPQALRITAD